MTSGSATKTRIVIVDDHPIFRHGLRSMIESNSGFEVCGEASSVAEALQCCRDANPNIVVTDISLQDGSGIELVKHLVSLNDELNVLVLSMHDEKLFAERALRAGAKGYVNKEEAAERLVTALERVKTGRVYLSERMTERLIDRQVGATNAPDKPGVESLSDRELEVFEQIGRGETTRRIAEKLHLSPKTVESYREKIKAKLNLQNAAELTQHAVQWVLEKS